MPTAEQVPAIVDKVRRRLAAAEVEGIHLRISGEKLDDDWLYVVVEPSAAGIRASEHAAFMAKVERDLRTAGDTNVLLVPALTD
jgi:hypothetical protein